MSKTKLCNYPCHVPSFSQIKSRLSPRASLFFLQARDELAFAMWGSLGCFTSLFSWSSQLIQHLFKDSPLHIPSIQLPLSGTLFADSTGLTQTRKRKNKATSLFYDTKIKDSCSLSSNETLKKVKMS